MKADGRLKQSSPGSTSRPRSSRRRTARRAALLVLGTSALLAGCQDPNSPFGEMDGASVSADGTGITVNGWAIDPNTPAPIKVTVGVAGGQSVTATANISRADVGAAHPGFGAEHGYSVTVPASAGTHTVCVAFNNVGKGSDVLRTCTDVIVPAIQPTGTVETAAVFANLIHVVGWAVDPDAGGPIDIGIIDMIDGAVDDITTTTVTASAVRPEVNAATGVAGASGFRVDIPITTPGPRTVCVVALNKGKGSDRLLACPRLDVPDRRASAAVWTTDVNGSTVTLTGFASDPDAPGPLRVNFGAWGSVMTAADGRWSLTIPGLADGAHQICPTVPSVGISPGIQADRVLPCSSVVVGPIQIAAFGAAAPPTPVRPASGPLVDVDRDAGISARLSDGSVLWLFGDSVGVNPNGSMKYFVGGTGAWARASSPATTTDAATASGSPYLLAAPTASFPTCPTSRGAKVHWPLSAVTVPDGQTDRVIVYLANMCLGSIEDFEFKGVSVAEFRYDPTNPPVDRPVTLTILEQNLFGARAYGSAAVLGTDGYVYAYQCDRPTNLAKPDAFGPCRVARSLPATVASAGSYQYWTGSTWSSTASAAAGMSMPAGTSSGYRYPASSFNVVYDDTTELYTMVYSPWPGFIDQAAVRVSESPLGPWTAPVAITYPDCENTVNGARKACYAATPQVWNSSPGRLGLGIYDQASAWNNRRGQYLATSVPFVVTRRGI